jgi:hypothetical protein
MPLLLTVAEKTGSRPILDHLQVDRITSETQARIKLDAKILQMTAELNALRVGAARSKEQIAKLEAEVASTQQVVTVKEELLQKERRQHKTTKRMLRSSQAEVLKLREVLL